MANPEQLERIKGGVAQWNLWRASNDELEINLSGANLRDACLIYADLSFADLSFAQTTKVYGREVIAKHERIRHLVLGSAKVAKVQNLTNTTSMGNQLAV